jgi:hypothetical protein
MNTAQLRWSIPSLESIEHIRTFFTKNYGKTASRSAKENEFDAIPEGAFVYSDGDEMTIVENEHSTLQLCKDGEFPDRFTLIMTSSTYSFNYDIHDPQTQELIQAFNDLRKDLGTE